MNTSEDNTIDDQPEETPVSEGTDSQAAPESSSDTETSVTEAPTVSSEDAASPAETSPAETSPGNASLSGDTESEVPQAIADLDELDDDDLDGDYEDDEFEGDVDPIEEESEEPTEESDKRWYILKVQVNRENSICDALSRRVKMHGLEGQFGDILVPTEDIKEFTKTGKQRIVKRKLYPGYIVVNMAINDDTWFIVRETPGIGDFTGSAGKPAPLDSAEIDKILKASRPSEAEESDGPQVVKNAFPFKVGDQVRVNEGNFQNLEGGVETIDESNGRITVMLNMFGRPTPVQLDHWQVEKV